MFGNKRKFDLPARFIGQELSVWEEYIELAQEYQPLDLGQGFPDFAAPKHITNALAQVAITEDALLHQYTRGCGHPRLIAALSKLYSPLVGHEINPNTEILVSAGAYGALYSTIIGHIDVGDEVIVIEPFFDCYEPMILAAGGIPRFIPLRFQQTADVTSSSDFVLDPEELAKMFNSKTKAIIVNTPNNPIGKVYTEKELQIIADLCKKWDVMCISDEVYEWLVYKPNKHVRMASLPGMWERTITVGSAGKTFSITGWKIGWAYGPADLVYNLQIVHQNSISSCSTPLQEAIAIGFEIELAHIDREDCYFKSLANILENKKNYMAKVLTDIGMKPIIPEGGYFMLTDWSALESHIDLNSENDNYRDYRFTKWLSKNIGVQGIPSTAFYSKEHKFLAENYIRWCFIKEDEKLEKAAEILKKWKCTK